MNIGFDSLTWTALAGPIAVLALSFGPLQRTVFARREARIPCKRPSRRRVGFESRR